jgi:uncharacterized protein
MLKIDISEKTKSNRHADRTHYDRELLYKTIDEALICHVGCQSDGTPVVVPTACWRKDNRIYCHGNKHSRVMRAAAKKEDACITVTHLDGLVLAAAGFSHSLNYRSAMMFGQLHLLETKKEMLAALDDLVNHIIPGRAKQVRTANEGEAGATAVFYMELEEASIKMRNEPPMDSEEDQDRRLWTGEVPIRYTMEKPIPSPYLVKGVKEPDFKAILKARWER